MVPTQGVTMKIVEYGKYLFVLLMLSSCASTPPVGKDWVTVWDENRLPMGSYNPKTDDVVYYAAPNVAFKALIRAVILAEQQRIAAAQKPVPVKPAPVKKQEKK